MTRHSISALLLGLTLFSSPTLAQGSDKAAKQRPKAVPVSVEKALEMPWFLPGQVLRATANSDSEIVARLEQISALPVSAEDGPWREVTFRGKKGWIDSQWQIPWDRESARRSVKRTLFERPSVVNRKWLGVAKKILGAKQPARSFGATKVYTDVEDTLLLEMIERLIRIVPDAYFARYGRLPTGQLEETIVLFEERDDYLKYIRKTGNKASENSGGHASWGLMVMWKGKRSPSGVASILVHEITHILNDRALAFTVQPWLEEGIASDLGSVWFEMDPEDWILPFQLEPLDNKLYHLYSRDKRQEMPGIGALASVDQAAFSESEFTSLAYTHSSTFIRFLASNPELSTGFRRFLERIANQEFKGTMGLLIDTLKIDIETLDQMFRRWVQEEGHRIWAGKR